jgi:tetratricopeptide (TPR) repeat protein
MHTRSRSFALGAVLAAVTGVIGVAAALAPPLDQRAGVRPERADAVLTRVPSRRTELGRRIGALAEQTRAAPNDLRAALALARAHIQASRVDGDPRPLGYAEAALLPFSAQAVPPAEVLVLQATIHQSRHQFEPALAELERALALAPDDAQAWLTRASILGVRGRYAEALQSCRALQVLTPAFVGAVCEAGVAFVTGRAGWADALLRAALDQTRSGQERAWVLSVSCELSYWTGQPQAAERACRAALKLDAADRFTRALLADVLLDQGQELQAFELCQGHHADDALLLRASLAAAKLSRSDASALASTAHERFALNRLRGDALHQREEARLLLASGGSAERALTLAQQNFATQREPWDARLLLEAALAAHAPQAAEPALAWLRETGFEAPRLHALRAQLENAP